jgi:hypothetical protein
MPTGRCKKVIAQGLQRPEQRRAARLLTGKELEITEYAHDNANSKERGKKPSRGLS